MISFHTNHRLLLVAPALTFALLTTVIAILPAIYENRLWPGDPDRKPLPADVARGRELYMAEGCSYCHTQQVRVDTRRPVGPDGRFPPLAADARWGRPTTPEDYADQDPPLLGTQRTGPDLADAAGRIPSADWHYTHLYDPRLVVPDSRMPAYRWYFHDGRPSGARATGRSCSPPPWSSRRARASGSSPRGTRRRSSRTSCPSRPGRRGPDLRWVSLDGRRRPR